MKLPCEMIRDLLPLYHDGVCSQVSEELVKVHLEECEACQQILKGIDAEIQMPELEKEMAEPLVSIQLRWNKEKKRAFLKGLSIAAAACLVLVAGWWMLFKWYIVPVAPEDVEIREVSRTSDGRVYIEKAVPYKTYYPYHYVSEDGVQYSWYTRPIGFGKKIQGGSSYTAFALDEDDIMGDERGNPVTIVKYCIGKPGSEDVIVIWEQGMELPIASEKAEYEVRQWDDAFEAPNAPEKPEILSVVPAEQVPVVEEMTEETAVIGD